MTNKANKATVASNVNAAVMADLSSTYDEIQFISDDTIIEAAEKALKPYVSSADDRYEWASKMYAAIEDAGNDIEVGVAKFSVEFAAGIAL